MPQHWLLLSALPWLFAAGSVGAQGGDPVAEGEPLAAIEPIAAGEPVAADEPVEIVVVTGRQPGPPLWRVIHGDNVLYIFATLSPIPEGMIWESDRVATVLAQSQEVLLAPDVDADFSATLLLNPINLIRGPRLINRLSKNPDDASLEDVLPPELFARYQALRLRYFPREDEPEDMRPLFAGALLSDRVLREEGLVSGNAINKQLERLMRRNRELVETDVEVTMDLTGSFKSLAARAEALVESLSGGQELACFTQEIGRLENEIEDMKSRANAWAQGNIGEFRGIPLPGDDDDACQILLVESSEFETIGQITAELERRWLEAAERALASNRSTFAILDIVELLSEDGLLADLKAKGYEVREP